MKDFYLDINVNSLEYILYRRVYIYIDMEVS